MITIKTVDVIRRALNHLTSSNNSTGTWNVIANHNGTVGFGVSNAPTTVTVSVYADESVLTDFSNPGCEDIRLVHSTVADLVLYLATNSTLTIFAPWLRQAEALAEKG